MKKEILVVMCVFFLGLIPSPLIAMAENSDTAKISEPVLVNLIEDCSNEPSYLAPLVIYENGEYRSLKYELNYDWTEGSDTPRFTNLDKA